MTMSSRSWLITIIFCLISFAIGYTAKSRVDARPSQSQLVLHRNWERASRGIWPGLSEWSDTKIEAMLSKPVGFRSAFDECSERDDEEIVRIMQSDPPVCVSNIVPACIPSDESRVTCQIDKASGKCVGAKEGWVEIDPATGERLSQKFTRAEMMQAKRIGKAPGSIPSNWTK